jgi:protein involved in polysaccharide export with SLBB domain
MRSCLFLGLSALCLLFQPTVSSAQADFLGTNQPSRGAGRSAGAAPLEAPAQPPGIPNSGGITVSRDSKLTAGDEITVLIKEDRDPPLRTAVSDTGEVELNGLGRVYVAGKNTAEAEAAMSAYLKQKYYHQATVEVGIVRKAIGTVRPYKVVIAGKVGRPGPQYFTGANPLRLTEAVIVATPNLYSDLRKVRLTRGGQTTDHDIESITKKGRTDLDIQLQDNDQIFVPAKSIRFFGE